MNGKWIISKPIYVKLSKDIDTSQINTPSSPTPSNMPVNITRPALIPMPYFNLPTMFYQPTVMIPAPLNYYPIPTVLPNPRVQTPNIRSSLPPPPPLMTVPLTETPKKRQFYPYIPVKSDDQQNDS